jgi:hypothetical protein
MTDVSIRQDNITAAGDVAGGDVNRLTVYYQTEARRTLLRRLASKYAAEVESGTTIGKTIEDLS